MAFTRAAGILLHPTSLPNGGGIGDFGAAARQFIDYLQRAGQKLWQILPLGPANDSGSPYQTFSSFAGNPLLISLDDLVSAGLLTNDDLAGAPSNSAHVNFLAVRQYKNPILRKAFAKFKTAGAGTPAMNNFISFKDSEKEWLTDYALFFALHNNFGGKPWWQWEEKNLISRDPSALTHWTEKLAAECEFQQWTQFIFYAQWTMLKKRANAAGVKIIGDIPIYTAHDSADVWANPKYFALDRETGAAKVLSGAPPDYFCPDGQLWGNPVYDWDALKRDGYGWWARRLKMSLRQADILRLDHFRGFEAYWATPGGEKTARNGKWVKGPGQDFFDVMQRVVGDNLPLIAEDLGVITPEVTALREKNNFPGMKVLQFAFGDGANFYRPHTYEKNCVVYTGTHDNDTTHGWYSAQGTDYAHMGKDILAQERDLARRYMAIDGRNINWDMMRLALSSVANTVVYPMQDVLSLGNDSRLNRPGSGEGNWAWRMTAEQLQNAETTYLRELAGLFDR